MTPCRHFLLRAWYSKQTFMRKALTRDLTFVVPSWTILNESSRTKEMENPNRFYGWINKMRKWSMRGLQRFCEGRPTHYWANISKQGLPTSQWGRYKTGLHTEALCHHFYWYSCKWFCARNITCNYSWTSSDEEWHMSWQSSHRGWLGPRLELILWEISKTVDEQSTAGAKFSH